MLSRNKKNAGLSDPNFYKDATTTTTTTLKTDGINDKHLVKFGRNQTTRASL